MKNCLIFFNFLIIFLFTFANSAIIKKRYEAENYSEMNGVTKTSTAVTGIHTGDWIRLSKVELLMGTNVTITLRISNSAPYLQSTSDCIGIYINAPKGETRSIGYTGRANLPGSGGGFGNIPCNQVVNGQPGSVDIYICFESVSNTINLDYIEVASENSGRIGLTGTEPIYGLVMIWGGSAVTVNGTIYAYASAEQGWYHNDHTKNLDRNRDMVGGVRLYTSPANDGINWTDRGIVLGVGKAGEWDDMWANMPGVWYDPVTKLFHMVYEGRDRTENEVFHVAPYKDVANPRRGIGYATSTDGITWTKEYGKAILQHNSTSTWEVYNVGTPKLFKKDSKWHLTYCGTTPGFIDQIAGLAIGEGSGTPNKIAPFGLPGGLVKHPECPIFPCMPNGWDSHTTGSRNIIYENGLYYMIYEGAQCPTAFGVLPQPNGFNDCIWNWGIAASHDLIHWTRHKDNPISISSGRAGLMNDGPTVMKIGSQWYVYSRSPSNGFTTRTPINFANYNFDYEVENSSYHYFGHSFTDGSTSGWGVNKSEVNSPVNGGQMIYGPYTTSMENGDFVASFRMKITDKTTPFTITVDVCSDVGKKVWAQKVISSSDFPNTNQYVPFKVPFFTDKRIAPCNNVEFRVYTSNNKYDLLVDNITISNGFNSSFEAESDLTVYANRTKAYQYDDGFVKGRAMPFDLVNGLFLYGPYTSRVEVGKNIAAFKLAIDDNAYGQADIIKIDVVQDFGRTVLASRSINRNEFKKNYEFQYFELPFINQLQNNNLEFRVFTSGLTWLCLDKVLVFRKE